MSNTNTLKINKSNINQDKLRSFAAELAKDVKTQADLADLSSTLLKMTVEAALGAEMEHHLGYPKYEQGGTYGNARNGYGTKTLKGDHGEIELSIPRDRNADFEPIILGKGVILPFLTPAKNRISVA